MNREMTNVTQKLWGWKVAAHLFLVGAGAGAYIASFFLSFLHPELASPFLRSAKVGIIAAVPLLIAGGIFFLANLGTKANAVRAFNRPWSSWLSAGSVIMLLFITLDLVLIGTWVSAPAKPLSGGNLSLGIINLILAVFILIYSGMLLKALKPFTFWNTGLLPLLSVFAGLSAGIMVVVFVEAVCGFIYGAALVQPVLLSIYHLNFILIIQAVVLGWYLWRAAESPRTRGSLLIVTSGQLALTFWLGVVVAGLTIPLAFGFYLVSAPPQSLVLLFILALELSSFGIVGSLLLRYLILRAGTSATITIRGQSVHLPENARIPASQRVKYHAD